jgi:hypothetical protein
MTVETMQYQLALPRASIGAEAEGRPGCGGTFCSDPIAPAISNRDDLLHQGRANVIKDRLAVPKQPNPSSPVFAF